MSIGQVYYKLPKIYKLTKILINKKIDKLRNLLKFVLVLLSASVKRVGVSRMRDFLLECGNFGTILGVCFWIIFGFKLSAVIHQATPILQVRLADGVCYNGSVEDVDVKSDLATVSMLAGTEL